MRATDNRWPTVDCSMPRLCSTVQWVHLAYGRVVSTRNRPRPSALPNRRNVCIYQRLCAFPVKAFGVVPSVNSECVHLSHGIQQPQPSGRWDRYTGTLYLRVSRELRFVREKRGKREKKGNRSDRGRTRSVRRKVSPRANTKFEIRYQISETLSRFDVVRSMSPERTQRTLQGYALSERN